MMKLSEKIAERYEADLYQWGEDRDGVDISWIEEAQALENEIERLKNLNGWPDKCIPARFR